VAGPLSKVNNPAQIVYRMAQRKDETVVTSAESFPKVEKREMTTDRTRPIMPVLLKKKVL